MQERQESRGDIDEAGKVHTDLLVEGREVHLIGLGEIVHTLNASVEEDAVDLGTLAGDSLHELAQVLAVVNIVCEAVGFAAVFADEVLDPGLSTANGDDLGTFMDELFRQT